MSKELHFIYDEDGTPVAAEYDGVVQQLDEADSRAVPAKRVGVIHDVQTSIRSTLEEMKDSYSGGSIVVGIEATHGGYTNSNNWHYLTKGMRKHVNTWTTPYPRPYIVNHDMETEPRGRVRKAKFVATSKTTGYHDLEVAIGHEDEIGMVLDMRALTVSVGSSPIDTVECAVCQQDLFHNGHAPKRYALDKKLNASFLKGKAPGMFGAFGMSNDEFWDYDADDGTCLCRHVRGIDAPMGGKDSQKTFWYLHGQTYREVSRVNMPADTNHATGEFAHIREILEQTDGLDPDTRLKTLTETLSRVESGMIDRARWQIVSEKELYTPTNDAEAVTLARRSGHQCMFDTGLWLTVQGTFPQLAIDDQVVEYHRRGGAFVYRPDWIAPEDALAMNPTGFANWLRRQADMNAEEKSIMDRLYTSAYIRKHVGTSR